MPQLTDCRFDVSLEDTRKSGHPCAEHPTEWQRWCFDGVAEDPLTLGADQTVYFDGAGDAPQISLVGDSTLSAVRWYEDYGELEQFNFVMSAESCRRTIERSCMSREGYRADNVITAMRSLDGELGDVLVVMSGYNDPVWTIDEAIAGVVDEARGQRVGTVVWLSLRTSEDVDYTDPLRQSGTETFSEYNEQLVAAAASSDGVLQVADWATYSNGELEWFEADGVHLTPQGVDALTTFVADTVQQVLAGNNVSPAVAPWTVLAPGAEGERVSEVQRAVIAAGVEVAGGADGIYGDATTAAIEEYQRSNDLEVTGTVDLATARALGVYEEQSRDNVATAAPVTTTPGSPRSPDIRETTAPNPGNNRVPSWLLVTVAATLALTGAVIGRGRYVAARRSARRWARVHPSTSPGRTVADLRRADQCNVATRPEECQQPVGPTHLAAHDLCSSLVATWPTQIDVTINDLAPRPNSVEPPARAEMIAAIIEGEELAVEHERPIEDRSAGDTVEVT